MSRLPRLTPDQLDAEQRDLYDAIAGGPRSATTAFRLTDDQGGLEGPFNAMLLRPGLGDPLQRLGAAIRYQGELSERARELAILTVASHWRSEFERHAHEAVGRLVGLTDAEVAAVRRGERPELADAEEAAVADLTRLLLTNHALSDDEYAAARASIGPAKLFELTTLVGYYELLAFQLRVFGVD